MVVSFRPSPSPQLSSLAVRITVIRTASDDSCGEGLRTRLHLWAATINAGAPVEWFGVLKIIASYILMGPQGR